MQKVIAEIDDKKRRGLPLLPNLKSAPDEPKQTSMGESIY